MKSPAHAVIALLSSLAPTMFATAQEAPTNLPQRHLHASITLFARKNDYP
jgi:hypothetical protein